MRIKRHPEEFQIEECIALPEGDGPYVYYRVEKQARSTRSVRDELAAQLSVRSSALVFPATKNRVGVAAQYLSVRKQGPAILKGAGYVARRVGSGPRALRPKDLSGNRFSVMVSNLDETEAAALAPTLARLEAYGLPNYFDDQRFGSMSRDGLPGKQILMHNAERVVQMYLAEPMAGDRREIRRFKRLVAGHWGQWGFLLHQAPRPSNYRSVIIHLRDHPHDYREAANLIHDKLLSIYLIAYQAWVWNQIVGAYLMEVMEVTHTLNVMHRPLTLPDPNSAMAAQRTVLVDLPRLTASYEGLWRKPAEAVLAAEGLSLRDFRPRMLRRVCLTKRQRAVVCTPMETEVTQPELDREMAERRQVVLRFTLDEGQYASLVLKAVAALIGSPFQVH